MIHLIIELHQDGCLKEFRASGHSGGSEGGGNIVCASATTLLRTAAKLLHADEHLRTNGEAPEAGQMWFSILDIPSARVKWVQGVTDFLVGGLLDLRHSYPEELSIEISRTTN